MTHGVRRALRSALARCGSRRSVSRGPQALARPALVAALMCGAAGALGQEQQSAGGLKQLRVESHAGAPTATGPVAVRAWPSQTAVWVGDRLTYTIELACEPNVDVLQEDLSRDKLRLDGLEMLATSAETVPRPGGGTLQRTSYELASYRVDTSAVSIGELTVRYYFRRGDMRPEDIRPAGEVRVAAVTIALRSTIPDEGVAPAVRDARAAEARARWTGWLTLGGLALLVLAAAPVAWWIVDRARRRRPARPRDSARKRRAEHRAAIDEIRALDPSSVAELRDAYTRLDALLRDHLRRAYGISAHALTPGEMEAALTGRDGQAAADVGRAFRLADDALQTCPDLLRECERARYAPAGEVPGRDAWRRAIERAGDLIGGTAG